MHRTKENPNFLTKVAEKRKNVDYRRMKAQSKIKAK